MVVAWLATHARGNVYFILLLCEMWGRKSYLRDARNSCFKGVEIFYPSKYIAARKQ